MQQVNIVGYRLGSTIGWISDNYSKTSPEMTLQMRLMLQRVMIKQGQFLLTSYAYQHRGVTFGVAVYYRYYQRSRLERWLVKRLRQRTGALAPLKTRIYMLHKLDVSTRRTLSDFNKRLKTVFPKAGLKGFTFIARQSWKLRGWVDLEVSMFKVFQYWPFWRQNHVMRKAWSNWVTRGEFRGYNVLALVEAVNPTVATKHYMFKRFNRLMYQLDLVQVILLSTKLNMANLLAHTIIIGLERHARRRQQMRFLKMVKTIITHVMMWENVEDKLIWRISVFGKLDAKMRRTHFKMRVGFVRYQHLDWTVASSRSVSRTRFGTSSVRVWMRNLLN